MGRSEGGRFEALKILAFRVEVEQWRATLSDHERLIWAAPTTVLKHCPVFAHEREEARPKRQAPRPEDALRADAERERAQRQGDDSSEGCHELKEELESARLQIEDPTRQLAEAVEERVLARDELAQLWQNSAVPVLTWHDLIERAIALLRAMPEDSRTEAMNQWASAASVNVYLPKKPRRTRSAKVG